MTEALIEAGTLQASLNDRKVSGLLLPYGEVGNTNLGKFSIEKGAVRIPRDASVVGANTDHDRESPVGRAESLTDTDAGIVATFSIADTDEGDALLLDISEGRRTNLSAEVKGIVLRAGKAVAGSLFGAAFVAKGAFPSAALMASDVGDLPEDKGDLSHLADTLRDLGKDPKAALLASIADATQTTDAKPAADTKPNPQEDTVGIPNTLTASAPAEKQPLRKSQVLGLLNAAKNGRATQDALTLLASEIGHMPDNAATLFGALNDIVYDGTDGKGPATTMGVPQWLGELYSEATKPYKPTYTDLFGAPAGLTALQMKGWRYKTALAGGAWQGNKTAIPTGNIAVEPVSGNASRFAGGVDVAREYVDFPGFEGFFDDLFTQLARSYEVWKDQSIVGPAVVAAATAVEADNPSGLSIGAALSKIIDGAVAVASTGTLPSFAIVDFDDYKEMLKTPQQDVLGYLNAALNLTEGDLSGFKIRPSLLVEDGSALVGSSIAATIYELPGAAPIRVSAPNIAQGGTDIAVFGYAGALVTHAEALVKVTPYSA
ncbi:hypothetical protein [Curtobacterium sp. MCBD17_040]|uniref:hypothetical protein n=1 Tax=Curtobacterium sp. MCBD17_040 TaxID=2175674 RepID=UPI000DA94A3D|nr:hypothetical protein [Curtobacterium sp. MCBD17_040]WIB64374.1 hypothetical protein DEI94_04035 [Curtobacterium sp. MCBD17_040]